MRGRQGIASHGTDRPSRVGTRRASIRKNIAAEIAVDASMLTALLRPRMTFFAVNAPDRTGGSKSSPSEGNPEKSSSIAVVGFVVAPATSSITGQSTLCSGLSTLAVPYHREGAPWDATSLDKQRPRSLAQFPRTTTAKSSGCSRSAPA
jgi:hypothetical protein